MFDQHSQEQEFSADLLLIGELAEGLRVLHAAGLMHRDVKPANVMITPADHAVLLDFGAHFQDEVSVDRLRC